MPQEDVLNSARMKWSLQ